MSLHAHGWSWWPVPIAVISEPTMRASGSTQLPGSSSQGHHLLRPPLGLLRSPKAHCCSSEGEFSLLALVQVSSRFSALHQAQSPLFSQNDSGSTSSFLSHCPSTSRELWWLLSLLSTLFLSDLEGTEPSRPPLSLNKPLFVFQSSLCLMSHSGSAIE